MAAAISSALRKVCLQKGVADICLEKWSNKNDDEKIGKYKNLSTVGREPHGMGHMVIN